MVVLAASVVTRSGKAVLSRQFREMPKARVEALLAALPGLLSSAGSQHTTVETDHVRYVYQPLEELNMVLITNKASNILQDISTLHLFAQIVTSLCRQCNEQEILRHAFDIIEAFDEVCSMGHRENLTLPQIKNFLEMDSHEERVQEIIEKNKELEATEERKRRAKQLEQQRKEMQRRGLNAPGMSDQFRSTSSSGPYTSIPRQESFTSAPSAPSAPAFQSKLTKSAPPRGKGLALGRKSKQSDLFEAVRTEAESVPLMIPDEPAAAPAPPEIPTSTRPTDMEAVHVKLTETLEARANRDGGLESVDVKGDLSLLISDREKAKCKVACAVENSHNVALKTHPNVDKSAFANDSIIALKDVQKAFPIDTTIGVLRWRHTLAASQAAAVELPVTLTCWPSPSDDGALQLTLEFEQSSSVTGSLEDVTVTVPLGSAGDTDPQIGETSVGSVEVVGLETGEPSLVWRLGDLDAQDGPVSAALELTFQSTGSDDLFPITCAYNNPASPFANIDVLDVLDATAQQSSPLTFSKESAIRGVLQIV
ncbi:coatomer subunit delta [Savitreella phatthalungensis]